MTINEKEKRIVDLMYKDLMKMNKSKKKIDPLERLEDIENENWDKTWRGTV